MLDGDGDGVGALQGVDPEHVLEVGHHELLQQLHVGLHRVHSQVLHVRGEPLQRKTGNYIKSSEMNCIKIIIKCYGEDLTTPT